MSNIQEIKDTLYAAFVREKKKRQPSYRGGANLDTALDKMAALCVSLKADPEEFVRVVAQSFKDRHDNFHPNMFIGSAAASIYKAYKAQYATTPLSDVWQTQLIGLQQTIQRTPRELKNILLDDSLGFYPWFRIVCTREPFPEVIALYGDAAKEQLTKELEAFLLTIVKPEVVDRIKHYERFIQ